MAEYTREQKLQILDKLPADLQAIFTSENTAVISANLRKKYSIPNEKAEALAKIIGNVVLGLSPLTNLAQEINTQITPDMQTALHLAQDLNVQLFFPVVESLKQAPAIANAVLTGQPIPAIRPAPAPAPAPMTAPATPVAPRTVPIAPAPMVPATKPAPVAPPATKMPGTDRYREPAEPFAGSLKPKVGPEPMPAPKPVVPPVVTLRPIEKVEMPKPPAAPAPVPQPIKVPVPMPTPQPAPIKIPVAPAPTPAPAPAAPKPLTFTKPVMPSGPKPDTYREPVEMAPLPVPPQLPTQEMAHPQQAQGKQFIASPAEHPIDLEEPAGDIIDLRQDRGKF